MSANAESLCDSCRATDRCGESQLELIKAHVDALKTVIGVRLEGGGDALGAELVGLLRDAVGTSQP